MLTYTYKPLYCRNGFSSCFVATTRNEWSDEDHSGTSMKISGTGRFYLWSVVLSYRMLSLQLLFD